MATQTWTKNSLAIFKEDYRPGNSIIKFPKGSGFFVADYADGFVEIQCGGINYFIPEEWLTSEKK